MKVKRHQDVYLTSTGLDWVIIRPGTLTDAVGTGSVALGAALNFDDVPRDDVAVTLTEAVHQPRLHRIILELGTTLIAQAVADAA
ncbi:NAD(P)H-binding protein [Streptomyces sp. NPDC057074]|uniref:NAD(P)H-binding protein n=1 Tax=Streptomyces sp. NPDC057074 TaxID=3346015 RepID=UPI00363D0F99